MKHTLTAALLLLFFSALNGQTADADTSVYPVVDNMPYPLLNTCHPGRHEGWTEDSVRICAENQLVQLLASNIQYPEAARQNNTTGTVVASFIVEKDGRMSHYSLLKDIGDGCGDEALRVLQALDEAGLRWRPAVKDEKAVRMQKALPIRFKLQEALPYIINPAGDTVYTSLDTAVDFKGGLDSLASFVVNQLSYPASEGKSCRTGVIEMALLVRSNGSISVENQLDYNNLGMDYQFEAIRLANKSKGLWTPATYEGKAVGSTFPLRVVFKSPDPGCATANEHFEQAMILANEGAQLSDTDDQEGAVAKWTQALELHPNNTEIMYYRGSAYFALNKREEGCADYNAIRDLLGVTWFESIRRILCGN